MPRCESNRSIFAFMPRNPVGEFRRILDPQTLARIVPAVIDQIRSHRHSALFHQLLIELADDVEHSLLANREPQVVPAVVVEQRCRRPGTLALDVEEETAAQLSFGIDAGDRGEVIGLRSGDIEFAFDANANASRQDQIAGPRHLDAEETAASGCRTTRAEAHGGNAGNTLIDQLDTVQRHGLLGGLNGECLAEVVRAIAQFGTPEDLQAGSRMVKARLKCLPAKAVSHPDSFGLWLDGVSFDGCG